MNSAITTPAPRRRTPHALRLLIVAAACAVFAMALPSAASAADVFENLNPTDHPCKLDATPEVQTVDKSGTATITVTLTDIGPIGGLSCIKPISPLLVQALLYKPTGDPSHPVEPVLDSSGNQIVRGSSFFDDSGHATITITINGTDCNSELLKIRSYPPVTSCSLLRSSDCYTGGKLDYDFVEVDWTGCNPPPPPPPPPVTPPVVSTGAPAAKLALSKKCTRNYMLIKPSASNGAIKSVRVYVDGRRVKTLNASPFSYKLRLSSVGSGKHKVKVVYEFTDGSTKTVSRTFRNCANLSANGNRAPGFTG